MLPAAAEALAQVEPFEAGEIEAALRGLAERLGLKPRDAFQPIRLAVTGSGRCRPACSRAWSSSGARSPSRASPAAAVAGRAGPARAETGARRAFGRAVSAGGGRPRSLSFLSDKTREAGKRIRRDRNASQAPTVLIVDDDASLRLLCRVNLELEGYHVLEAPSVAAAEDARRGGPGRPLPARRPHRRRRRARADALAARRASTERRSCSSPGSATARLGDGRGGRRRRPEAVPARAAARRRPRARAAQVDSRPDERHARRPQPGRLRVAPAALPVRARRGGPRRPRRREGGLRARRDRRALRRAVHARPARRPARGRVGGRRRRGARAALPAAQDLRGGPDLRRAGRAGGRARERDPRRAGRVQGRAAAAAHRPGHSSRC